MSYKVHGSGNDEAGERQVHDLHCIKYVTAIRVVNTITPVFKIADTPIDNKAFGERHLQTID